MTLGLIGRKLGMSQCFDENGNLVPVTLVEAGPCTVLQKKNLESDGYNAIQIGFEDVKIKKADNPRRASVNKPAEGHFKKAGTSAKKFIREVRIDNPDEYEVGQVIDLDIFEDGEKIDVVGTSKGRGYQGVIKRHGQRRGPETHGSKYHRAPGSMGASATPSHVRKGKKLPGQMGSVRVTAQSLKIVKRDKENNLLAVRGSIPGWTNGVLLIKKAIKAKTK